jgi:tryptophan 2,3-dioxygenase
MNELREPKFAEEGGSDYEVYIRTDELLALQPEPDTWKHRDELLFTVVHQSSELWLKLAVSEIDHALLNISQGKIQAACRYFAIAHVGENDTVGLSTCANSIGPRFRF